MRRTLRLLLISGGLVLSTGVGTVGALSATGVISLTNPDKKYVCHFYNYDNTLLFTAKVEPSHSVAFKGKTPVKPDDEAYYYEFKGWDKETKTIIGDTDFVAQFEKHRRDYNCKFINYDNTILYETVVESGGSVYYPYEDPVRPNDDRYGYTFVGWDESLDNIYSDKTFVAQFEKTEIQYNVYFYDYDETLLYTDQVYYGGNAQYLGPTLVGPDADEGYHYEFDSWSSSIMDITEDTAVIANYRLEMNKYIVSYFNYDNDNLYTDQVIHGESSVYLGPTPHRPSDEKHSYKFVGWDTDTKVVTEDLNVYAIYEESDPDCTIVFKDWNLDVLDTQTVEFGSDVTYGGEEPTREEDEKYTYKFIGWDRELDSVHDSFDTIAQYEATLKKFTITYLNYNLETLDEIEVDYGTDATDLYSGETPTKPNDQYYSYTFAGWNEDLTEVTSDLEVVALFDAKPLSPVVDGNVDDGGSSGSSGGSGSGPGIGPGTGGSGGGGGGGPGDSEPADPKFVDIDFCDWNGTKLTSDCVIFGHTAHFEQDCPPETIIRPDDNKHTNYVFCGFDQSLENIRGDFPVKKGGSCITYAQYIIQEDIFDKYIVTFRDNDGTLLYECVVEENEMPAFPEGMLQGLVLKHDGCVFNGWNTPLIRADKSYTVYATYAKALPPGNGGGPGNGTGGSSMGGDIGFPDPNAESKKICTVSSTTYSGQVYLREHSFKDLNGSTWSEAKEYTTSTKSPLFYSADKLKQMNRYSECDLNVTYDQAPLLPATPTYFTNTNYPMRGDISQFGNGQLSYDYTFVSAPLDRQMYNLLRTKSFTSPVLTSEEAAYSTYVKNNYLSLSDNHKAFFSVFDEENHLSVNTIDDILKVADTITNSATYNLTGAKCPEDKDPIIYFLNESKEGVCNHFASALVLTYRSLGLPARFVTGYNVDTGPLAEDPVTGDMIATTNVTSNQGHAWCEIYIEGSGWVMIDCTPGYGGDNNDDHPYNPFGPLEINPPLLTITVQGATTTKTYDGTEMNVVGSYTGSFLHAGDHIEYNICEQESNVGLHTARCRPRILNANNEDVTDDYIGKVKMVFKSYKINQRLIEVTTSSATKNYDGLELIAHSFTVTNGELAINQVLQITYNGSQTNIGSSDNTISSFSIYDTETGAYVTDNYAVVWKYGKLTVNPAS